MIVSETALFVGRLLPHKGVNDLIEGLPPGLGLEIVGRPADEGYVRELRLKRAHQMLRDPLTRHLRVGDIAAMAGFSDLSHFNHTFRQRFGESPTDARRRR